MSLKIESYKKKNSSKTFYRATGYMGTNQKTGERKYFNRQGFKSKLDAKDAFEEAVSAFKSQTEITPKFKRIRFQKVYEQWLELHASQLEQTTQANIKSRIERHVIPTFGHTYVDAITIIDAEEWLNNVAARYVGYANYLSDCHQIMRFAVRAGYIDRDPFDYVERPRKVKRTSHHIQQNWYSLSELKQFVEVVKHLPDDDKSPRHLQTKIKALLMMVVSTGMRRGEAAGIQWADIDWKEKTVSVERGIKSVKNGTLVGATKTRSGVRTIYLDDAAIAALRDWKMKQAQWNLQRQLPTITPHAWVFPRNDNDPFEPLTPTQIGKWMKQTCENHGLRRITLHGLRHTKATLLGEAGADPADVAAILGHSNGTFTLTHYMHSTREGVVHAESLFKQYYESNG
jgi:integrase